ncbi:hypothetical protein ACC687_39100 [Rhizobium ruizarguesonis]
MAIALTLLVQTAMSMDLRLSAVLMVLAIAYWLIGRVVMRRTKEGQASVENHYQNVF